MGERNYGEDYPFQDTSEYVPRRGIAQHPAILFLLLASIVALLFLAYRSSTGDDDVAATQDGSEAEQLQSDEADDVDTGDEETGAAAADGEEDGADQADDSATEDGAEDGDEDGADEQQAEVVDLGRSAPIEPPETGAFVAAVLNLDAQPGGGLFVLDGRVPDQTTADAVLRAAEVSYAPFVESRLTVDESLPEAPWLAVAPNVIGLLPSVTDGTIMVADGEIALSARSPNPDYLATLQGALQLLGGGIPVEVVDSKITDLEAPRFAADIDNGTITLDGVVPSDSVIGLLAGGANAVYGADNVVNNLTVDPGTYRSFWMATTPGILQFFQVFPKYDFEVTNGQFSGSIQDGIGFAADSTEISAEASQALNIGVAVLARDISVGMVVTGHTDSQGADEYNQDLSMARAQSVVDYFAAAGIDAARLRAEGAGESEPIADNETAEGRAQNRRVEFQFGPASELIG